MSTGDPEAADPPRPSEVPRDDPPEGEPDAAPAKDAAEEDDESERR